MLEFSLINQVTVYLISLLSIWLCVWVYFADRKNRVNQFFSLMAAFVFLWVVFAYVSNLPNQIHLALFWIRLNFGAVSLFFIAMYFFTVYFPKEEKRYLILDNTVLLVGTILFFSSVFTDLIIREIKFEKWGASIIFGKMENIFFIIVFLLTVLILGQLVIKYNKSSKKEKLKIRYFLVGIIIFALLNIIFNVIFPSMLNTYQYYQFGDYSAIFLLSFTAYAITKHELMGVKTLMTQVLIIIISLILLSDIILLSDDLTMQILKIGILISFLYFSRGMIESVKKEKEGRVKLESSYEKIDQNIKDLEDINIKLEEKNEDLGTLLNITDIITQTFDPKKIAQDIVNSVPKNLGYLKYDSSFLVLYDSRSKHAYAYFITESKDKTKIDKVLKKVFKKKLGIISICLGTKNLIFQTIEKREMQISDKLEDFIAPTVNVNVCKIIQKLSGTKSYISSPVFSRGRTIGAIVFMGIKPKNQIAQRDKDILSGFSSHIGTAIENAQLYEQTEKQNKALSVLNENLETANVKMKELMEMKNEFLHITSHQLRTPLTTIRGMISMWYSGDFDHLPPKEKRKMLKRIYISSERLNNITNDMLDSLELEGGFMKFKFEPVSLKEIIKEKIDAVKLNFEKKKLYLKFDSSVDIPKVEVEPKYIRQVFINLIDNAYKYTRKGGAKISLKKAGKYVEVIIKDTGIGVSESDQKKIFLKFTRGKKASTENASGSGLGLFIAQKIVAAHKGKIEFISKGAGKGSEVRVSLLVKQRK